MPRSLDPDATVTIVLETDKGKENPPGFIFKALTLGEEEKLGEIYDDLKENRDKPISKSLQEYLEPYLQGWENMGPFVFGEKPLKDVVTGFEAFDLVEQLLSSSRLSYEEKKRLDSGRSSEEESSADHADPNAPNISSS